MIIGIGIGIVLFLSCIILLVKLLVTSIKAFIQKDKRKGAIYAACSVLAVLAIRWIFFPSYTDPNSEEYKKLSNERNAYVKELEQDAVKDLGETTSRGDERIDIRVQSPGDKHFYILIELLSERGKNDAESRDIILNDIRTMLEEVKQNKQYASIKQITLTVRQYSQEEGNHSGHIFVQGKLNQKKLKRKDIKDLDFENYSWYFSDVQGVNAPIKK